MGAGHVIDADLTEVYSSETKEGFVRTLGWGDGAEVLDVTEKHVEVRTIKFEPHRKEA